MTAKPSDEKRIKISRINGIVEFNDPTLWEATRFPNHGSDCDWIVDLGLLVDMWNSVGHLFTPSESKRIYKAYAIWMGKRKAFNPVCALYGGKE